jgi:hypothetical protein
MAATKAQEGWDVQGYGRNFKSRALQPVRVLYRFKLQQVLYDPIPGLPAADLLVLVTAAHVDKPPFFECLECHCCGIVETGEKITCLVREALPAFQAERLDTQFQRTTMDKEDIVVNPFHGHALENGEERRIPQLLVAVCACGIAPADKEAVKVGMVMVPEDGYEPVLPGKSMDLLKSLLGPITAVKEVAEVDKDINRTKCCTEEGGLDTCCKCTDRT